jgi:hypothetical protein
LWPDLNNCHRWASVVDSVRLISSFPPSYIRTAKCGAFTHCGGVNRMSLDRSFKGLYPNEFAFLAAWISQVLGKIGAKVSKVLKNR